MGRAAHWPDIWLVVLGSIILLAWWLLARNSGDPMVSAFCSSATLWALPLSVRLNLVLMLVSPAQLASASALMTAAMMLPLIITPLQHVRDRSFARRRPRATILFVAGYVMVWMIAGVILQLVAFAARWAVPAPLLCFGLAVATAILWQVSPTKQWCLNRCHHLPHLAAFGTAADRDAFDFGLTNGASCAGSCWALMLATLLAGQGHILGMIAVTLFVFAEQLESPAPLKWRWRGPSKALRIIAGQARMRLTRRARLKTWGDFRCRQPIWSHAVPHHDIIVCLHQVRRCDIGNSGNSLSPVTFAREQDAIRLTHDFSSANQA